MHQTSDDNDSIRATEMEQVKKQLSDQAERINNLETALKRVQLQLSKTSMYVSRADRRYK